MELAKVLEGVGAETVGQVGLPFSWVKIWFALVGLRGYSGSREGTGCG